MLIVVIFIFIGIVVGRLLRGRRLWWQPRLTDILIYVLLLLLGAEVGSNGEVLGSLTTLGLEAVVVAMAAVVACCVGSWLMWRGLCRRKGETVTDNKADGSGQQSGLWQAIRGSLVIVGWLVIGIIIGIADWLPEYTYDDRVMVYTICALLCSVGIGVGGDPMTVSRLRSLPPAMGLLPVVTLLSTWLAMVIVYPLMSGRSLTDLLAIGSGLGYYSLSSVIITQMRGAELGTVALLSNIIREVVTLLAAPLMVRWFGPLAPISCGGATTADTTLPTIARCAGPTYVPLSVYHGFLMDFSVPFTVTFWCTIS